MMNTTQELTAAFKADVSDRVTGNRFTTYVGTTTEAAAVAKLESEGFDVLNIRLVKLTHLGGEAE